MLAALFSKSIKARPGKVATRQVLKPFKYQPLGENEIRIVYISPGDSERGEIAVRMVHVNRDSCPDYQLLTYAWGGPSNKCEIVCNGDTLEVPPNLHSALKALRESKAIDMAFWIDAICTNQRDIEERDNIFLLIRSMLENAIQTILWIGVESKDTPAALEIISKLVSARKEVFQDTPIPYPKNPPLEIALKRYQDALSDVPPTNWKFIEDITGRYMFTRSWTAGDIVLSRALTLRCGPFEVAWHDLCYGLQAYVCYGHPNELRNPGTQFILDMNKLREKRLTGRPVDLDHILEIMRNLEAVNPRDKIYAALGVINSSLALTHKSHTQPAHTPYSGKKQLGWLSVSYAISAEELYVQVAKALASSSRFIELGFCPLSMVEDSASLRRLEAVGEPTGSTEKPNNRLSSWVPDWREKYQIYRLNTTRSAFAASKGQKFEAPRFNSEGTMLFRGCVIDAVKKVAGYLPPRRWCDKYNVGAANSFFFLEWIEFARDIALLKYKNIPARLLLDWVNTIRAKGCGMCEMSETLDEASLTRVAKSWLQLFEDEDRGETEEIRQFHAACVPSYGRRFCISGRGNFCLIPRFAQVQDLICIPYGSKVPFVFRKIGDAYLNIGECYVHDAMNGEALTWEGIEEVDFVLQ